MSKERNVPASMRPAEDAIPVEAVARYPYPGMAIPEKIQFSPDDRLVTFLATTDQTLVRYLYAFDPAQGTRTLLFRPFDEGITDESVSLEEALRRERQRQMGLGVTHYAWAKQGERLLLPLQGNLYVIDRPGEPARLLVSGAGEALLDAQFSPDGQWVSYVQESEIYIVPTAGGAPRQLTYGARETGTSHGLAEYIAQEEMERSHGYWWSMDSQWMAFTEVNESHIPVYRIVHQGKDVVGEEAQEDHHYPFAGQANARVRLGVVAATGGDPRWLDLGPEDNYLARVKWLPGGRLTAQIENRAQTDLWLVAFDVHTGESQTLLHEHNDVWINLHDMFRPMKNGDYGGGFLWASERTGYRHLYLYQGDGRLIRPLTEGQWMVESIAGIDNDKGLVYFMATRESPLERHLYQVSLAGGEVRQISREPGTHTVVIDHGCRRYVDVHHSLDRPPIVSLRELQSGDALATIHEDIDPRIEEYRLRAPKLVSLENRDGFQLYGTIYRPPSQFGQGPYPTIVSVYGGPHAQRVVNGWGSTADMRAQYLASLGFLVFKLDNRGSAGRGLAFEGAIKHDMGHLEVEDQEDGIRWLVAEGLTDPERVGIYGWSYGGYLAGMCLARAPETFSVAVAGAPVSHWDGYDTHYTERYMGTPQSNPAGYETSSLMPYVEQIQGHLMLVHGLIDENVHFRHTARLINALIAARKPYELLLFPDERHSPRRLEDRVFMEERLRDFFFTWLLQQNGD